MKIIEVLRNLPFQKNIYNEGYMDPSGQLDHSLFTLYLDVHYILDSNQFFSYSSIFFRVSLLLFKT